MTFIPSRAVAFEGLEPRCHLSVGDTYAPPADPRLVTAINAGWKFSATAGSGASAGAYDDSAWSAVSLPHTWNAFDAQDGGTLYRRGTGWYRRDLARPVGTAGDRLILKFDGASLVTKVYIDGVAIGTHAGAFSAFEFDVTDALADGHAHHLAVQCDNSASLAQTVAPTSGADLNVDGGLYRGVSLIAVDPVHVTLADDASAGVFFSTPTVSSAAAAVSVVTDLADDGAGGAVTVRSVLADSHGTVVADQSNSITIAAGGTASVTQAATVDAPHLWNGVKDPYLYDLTVEVRDAGDGHLLDLVHQKVGLRSFAVDPAKGFFLNGKSYDLHGVVYQADRRNKGWAISDADTRQDFATIVDLGATVVRTHYELSPLFYDLADAAGIVVLNEVPMNGSKSRTQTFDVTPFTANAKQQLRELIRQQYNRPSIVSWGLWNELTDNATNDTLISTLNAYAHQLDPTRYTVGTTWNKSAGKLEKIPDALSFNRYYGWYYDTPAGIAPMLDAVHAANPNIPLSMGEYGAGAWLTQHGRLDKAGAYLTWQPEEYQNLVHEQTLPLLEARKYLWAKVMFELFDNPNDLKLYGPVVGENNKGLITSDRGTYKDSFYFYKANWSDQPVLYLTGHRWTSRTDSATVEVKAYANTDAPRLTLNGHDAGTLVSRGDGIFSLPAVTLAKGRNVLTVTATRDGRIYTDSVTWTYTGDGGTTPVDPPVDPPTNTGSISGTTFDDANANGLFDPTESPGGGKTVWLDLDLDGVKDSAEPSFKTGADGTFTFANLAPGTYSVRRVFPIGYTASTPPISVTLTAGQSVTGLLIGSKSTSTTTPPVTPPTPTGLSGFAFNDTNKNGLYDTGDTLAPAKTVWLDLDDDGVKDSGEPGLLTDAGGAFSFTGLAPRTYHVRRVFSPGYGESTPARSIALTSGQSVTGVSIGSKTK